MALTSAYGLARAAPAETEAPQGWSLVYDFTVQDVCTDPAGRLLPGVTPFDGHDKCPAHRDLRIGEALPYHKQDWPQAGDTAHKDGYSRNDEYPAKLGALGTVVVQARGLDQGARQGGGLFVFSDKYMASGLTQDPSGLQVFYGPNCDAPNPADRLKDAWIFVGRDFTIGGSGEALAKLTRFPEKCPAGLAVSFTRWHSETLKFRIRPVAGPESTVPLVTLVSDHFGGRDVASAGHLERFYFTRELGLIRWERWQSARDSRKKAVDREPVAAGKCDPVEKTPEAGTGWHMVRCRQWTNLIPSEKPDGDPVDPRFLETAKTTLSSIGHR